MKDNKKLLLKKITVLSLDDAQLIRGGEQENTSEGGDSYCGGCQTEGGPDVCPPTTPPNSCMVCDTKDTCNCV
jgi:hypothetical protein